MRARSSKTGRGSMIGRRLVVVALSVALPLASVTVLTPIAQAAEGCPDAFFVGVRGSGNSFTTDRGMGPSVEAVFESAHAALPAGTNLEPVALDYPAVSVPDGMGKSPAGLRYKDSVSQGAGRLGREVSDRLNSCSVTPLVIAGHSQGAQVIVRYMAEAGAPAMPNIVGVALLGDPTRFPTNPYNVAPNPPGAGVFHVPFWGSFRTNTIPPPDYWGVIDSYCITGDPICAGGPQRNFDVGGDVRLATMFADSQHSAYAPTGVSEQAGKVLARRITAALDATKPATGTFGPAIFNSSLLATGIAPTTSGSGYWFSLNDGGVDNFGDAPVVNSLSGTALNAPIAGMAATRTATGYWLVGVDGGVFAFGNAQFRGSLADRPLAAPIVGIAPTPTGTGYWLAGADGSVYAFGDAGFLGSAAGVDLAAPVVGIAATPDGHGYWLTAADGGVFAYGSAAFAGSMAGQPLNGPVVGITSTSSGAGYWLVASDGGVFAFGDAPFLGSGVDRAVTSAVVGIAANPTAPGYWLVASDGSVYGFGDAPLYEK